MKKYINSEKQPWYEYLRTCFLTWFGDIKFFKFPFFLVYDPSSYKVRGEEVREVIDLIQPGDVVLRAYDNYIDGVFIPGSFSHVGFYYGKSEESERSSAGITIDNNPEKLKQVQEEEFKTGEQMIIHAMADGVFMEDIINFCRCDKMIILRLPETLAKTSGGSEVIFKKTAFLDSEQTIRGKMEEGQAVNRSEVVESARQVALSCLGARYDFRFDFEEQAHNNFSCSEFAYYVYRSIDRYINLKPIKTCIMGICKKGIRPDQFLDTDFEVVWASKSVREDKAIQPYLKGVI